MPGYLQVNNTACGPTVTNHLFLLNKTKLRKYLLPCFLWRSDVLLFPWALINTRPWLQYKSSLSLSPSSPQGCVIRSLFSCQFLFGGLAKTTGQVPARLCTRILDIFFLLFPKSWRSSTSIHVRVWYRLDYRAKREPPIHTYNNTYNIIINISFEFISL